MGSEYKFPSGLSSITWNDTRYLNKNVIESAIIPEGVKIIGGETFSGFCNLTSVNIPDSVNRIEHSAFSYCSSLKSIVLPRGLNFIGTDAFADCSSLSSIVFPSKLIETQQEIFAYCKSLKTVVLPANYSSIVWGKNLDGDYDAFKFSRNIKNVYVYSSGHRIDKDFIINLFDQEIREKLSIYVLDSGYVVDLDKYNEMPTTQKNHTELMALENQIVYGRACEGYCVKGNNLLTAEEYNPIFENSIINS